jgi:FkbM family methyltransferase
MFIKAKTALEKGYTFSDKIKLFILAAYTSRPKFKVITGIFFKKLIKQGLIKLSLKSDHGRIYVVLRLADFYSDYLSMTEVMLENCYKIPFNKKFDIVIDGGGNTGLFTVLCNKVYPSANIIMFEPLEKNVEISKSHFKLNNSACEIKQGIISLKVGDVSLYIRNANNSSLSDLDPYTDKFNVKSYNLVNELCKHKFSEALIKLDIEGAEVEVIPDLLNNLKGKNLYIAGELHHWSLHLENLKKITEEHGYYLETYNIDSVCLLFHLYKS